MSFLDKNIEEYILPKTTASESNMDILFECDELDKYDFPDDVNLPEGEYYSMIVGLRNYKDKYNKQYVDVCYKVFNTKLKLLWENSKIGCVRYYYIRQRVLRDSDDERRFRYAMKCIIGSSNFTGKDLIGVTEYMKIYYDDDPKGSIVCRRDSGLKIDWFVDDVSEKFYHNMEEDLEEMS